MFAAALAAVAMEGAGSDIMVDAIYYFVVGGGPLLKEKGGGFLDLFDRGLKILDQIHGAKTPPVQCRRQFAII